MLHLTSITNATPTNGFHKGSNIRKPTVEKKSFHRLG